MMDPQVEHLQAPFKAEPHTTNGVRNGQSKDGQSVRTPQKDLRAAAGHVQTVRVLLVDDHPENLLAIEAALERLGQSSASIQRGAAMSEKSNGSVSQSEGGQARVPLSRPPAFTLELVRAPSGREALRKLLKAEFAVILLDVQMPGMDGYETASLIRQRTKTEATPIIFLTAINTSEANVFHGYALGAVDYLFKPFDPEILAAKVSVFVELYCKQQEIQRMANESKEQAALLRCSNDELAKTNKVMGGLYHELEIKSEELRHINEDLERRVGERTKELQETNQALWQAKESAEEANRTKDQFLAVLSHELRTPLTPVLATVQVLLEDPAISEDMKSWVETIGRNVQLEARLIDDLLDITRIANGKLQLHLGRVDTHTIIRETVGICAEDIRAKKLEITFDLNASDPWIKADSARLQQVLWNLVKNAVKFTPHGGLITLRTSTTTAGALRCQVIDTGIGIPAEHLDRVFRAFDQGGESITRQFGGLGLGLAISKALIEQQGGSIRAESGGHNKGATFTIEMPCFDSKVSLVRGHLKGSREKSHDAKRVPLSGSPAQDQVVENADRPKPFIEAEDQSELTRGHLKGSRDPTDVSIPNDTTLSSSPRILLVEDNPDTSHALQVLLERKGFTVIVAHTVHAAVEIAKTYPYELVISDIGLPDGDGLEVIRKLKAIRPAPGIAISGFGRDEDIRRSLVAGFSAHLVKPVAFNELQDVVQQLLIRA